MKCASFFAGIGGVDLAFQRAGHEVVYACEIDDSARAVYEERFGHAPAGRDINDVRASEIPDADLWMGGFPCTDVSTAGQRKGLVGTRSGLVWRMLALASEKKPAWILLENVPGLLTGRSDDESDDVADRGVEPNGAEVGAAAADPTWFGAILGGLAECGYGDVAWRVLDAQFLGVPQRRRRVFVLARRSGAPGPSPAEVLLERPGVRRRDPKGRAARSGAAGAAARGAGGGGGRGGAGSGPSGDAGGRVSGAVTSKWAKGTGGPAGDECQNLVAGTVQAHHGRGAPDDQLLVERTLGAGYGQSNDGPLVAATVRADDSFGRRGDGSDNLIAATLDADRGTPRGNGADNLVAATLTSGGHPESSAPGRRREDDVNLIPFDMAQVTHPENRARCDAGAPAPSLSAAGQPHVAYGAYNVNSATSCAKRDHARATDVSSAVDTSGAFASGQGGTLVEQRCFSVVPEGGQGADLRASEVDVAPATDGAKSTERGARVASHTGVRRLMPVETLRLQGLPDFWFDGLGLSDSVEYRLVGNSVAIPCLFWIAKQVAEKVEGRAVRNGWREAYRG